MAPSGSVTRGPLSVTTFILDIVAKLRHVRVHPLKRHRIIGRSATRAQL